MVGEQWQCPPLHVLLLVVGAPQWIMVLTMLVPMLVPAAVAPPTGTLVSAQRRLNQLQCERYPRQRSD
jgi:hypothetical protein